LCAWLSLSDKHRHHDGEDSYGPISTRPTYEDGIIAYTLTMRCPIPCDMIARRFTDARLCSLIIAIVAIGYVGEAFASEAVWLADSRSGPKADAPGESKDIQSLRRAAEEGNALAQFNLGLLYESGRGVFKDTAEAIKWFRKAADQGFDEAQYALGCCYNGDDGFPKDPVEAVKWWGKAAAQGYADAQYCLGLSYFAGEGVDKNPVEAAKWWRKAAEQNHAGAQYFLGLSYSLGLGVPKIREQAIYWLRKAAANGNENATTALLKLGKVAT
jgi:TPR repeat protein